MELKNKKIIKKVVKSFVIGVISSIFLFIFSLIGLYLIDSTFYTEYRFTMNAMISMSLFALISLQFAVISAGFIYTVREKVCYEKKIISDLPVLIPLLIILLLTIALKVQFFSYCK